MLAVRAEVDAYKRAGLLQDPRYFERGVIGLSEGGTGVIVEADDVRKLSSRRTHAIAAGRNVDHEGIRQAVQQIDPDTESLSEADPYVLDAVGDELAVFDAEGVEVITGVPADLVEGEPEVIAPEPSESGELMTDEQKQWIADHVADLMGIEPSERQKMFSPSELAIINGKIASVPYSNAQSVIEKMARLMAQHAAQSPQGARKQRQSPSTQDQGETSLSEVMDDGWTEFWQKAKASGFANAKELTKGAGIPRMPESLEAAELALKSALQRRRDER